LVFACEYFGVYVDDLIIELETNCEGCYVSGKFLGCIMYADDLLLLSASVSGLQSMLNICYCYGIDNDIIFNPQKSVYFKAGHDWLKSVAHVSLGNTTLK